MIVFIAGPMTGVPDMNRKAFNEVAEDLREAGYTVLNPAVLPDGLYHHDDYLSITRAMLNASDMIYTLPGWEGSKGAKAEFKHAFEKHLLWFDHTQPEFIEAVSRLYAWNIEKSES